ncbi:type II/IV secretion system protein [Accumulibacter sp.]|jgi:type II secretory ATPase GspE/PulE/Tfp pilus assembly ATPase PilB-like protein|uniref:Type II secretion system protein E n=1 Tax=Accumulibacter regalis TaxID=522306 RepID=C7RKW5_ACCRE|nr:type II/IV secretion system protein [Accumulibacter sp.]MBN8498299.1 Flp pilus assembly complex ATPase component TadA [Accumulibacter sp.]MBO3713784.1 Flp pilus assembly complex ATPase component TadA [Accumulibacter sp.]
MIVNEAALINAGLQAGLFDRELVNRLRSQARIARQSLLDALSHELRLPRTSFYLALAEAHGLPYAPLDTWILDRASATRLPGTLIKRHPMAPMRTPEGTLYLAISDPADQIGVDTARRILGAGTPLAVAEPEAIAPLLAQFAPGEARDTTGDEPVALFERLVREALLRRASDIHIESIKEGTRVRLRVDGRMQAWGALLPRQLGEGMISRIKVLAGMDIAESRAPQDGGLNYPANDGSDPMEMRVASVPAKFGERLTLRVMQSDPERQTLAALGMPPVMVERLQKALAHPHGIVLVTGPTGCGKSTTLYAVLRELDANALNILTAEDPVEQVIAGITQVQVSGKVDFAGALRSFLRHDPDVILVGEIRDFATADVALKAATTGHMVLSTLHTNTAVGAITRLADIGCERFLVGATLHGVIAQRLVRLLCTHCRQARAPTVDEGRLLGVRERDGCHIHEPNGCPRCLGTGYRGRVGLFEALWLDGELAERIANSAGERELAQAAGGYWRLADDARDKVLRGVTSLAEARPYLHPGL